MRYVVLHHTGWKQDHFDLMLEDENNVEGPLLTWRLDAFPFAKKIEALPPHRRIYLMYEGPVSGNRGLVRRVAEGNYIVLSRGDGLMIVRLLPDVGPIRLPLID